MKKIDWLNHLFNFIAVILGVFLAFYVSANAEKRKEKKELKAIVASLIDDLASDQRTYKDYQIPINKKQSDALAQLTVSILEEQLDSVASNLSYIIGIENYRPTSTTYLSSTSSGKINLIKDLDVRKNLSQYYDVLSVEAEVKGQVQADFFLKEILPWLIEHTNLADIDPKGLLGNQVLTNKIILYQNFIDNKTEEYGHIVEVGAALEKDLRDLLQRL